MITRALPQALIVTGMATKMPGYVDAGLRSLRWLMTQQTSSAGHFRPVGTAGFGEHRQHPRAFDQQPVEATATIAACLAAWRADGDTGWKAAASRAFEWFLGSNDLSLALVDLHTGSCATDCTPIVPMKTAAVSRSYAICLVARRFVSWRGSTLA